MYKKSARHISAILAAAITVSTMVGAGAAPCFAATAIENKAAVTASADNDQHGSAVQDQNEEQQEEKKEEEQQEEKKEDEKQDEQKEDKKEDDEDQDEEIPESAHVVPDASMQESNGSEAGYQWAVSDEENVSFWNEFQNKSAEEQQQYANSIIDEQNRAASVPVGEIDKANANGLGFNDIQSGITAAFTSIASSNPAGFIGWTAGTVFKQVFGEQNADLVAQSLQEIDGKMNEIKDQLSNMENRLDKIQSGISDIKKEQKAQNIRQDLQIPYTKKIPVETFISNMKQLDSMFADSAKRQKFYKQGLRQLNQETLNAIMQYGTSLVTNGVYTDHSVFYAVAALVGQNDLGWETLMREAQTYQNAILVTPYLEAVTYVLALKGYELQHCEEGSDKYDDITTDIELIQNQVKKVCDTMNANIIPDKSQGGVAFYTRDGKVILVSKKLRFQTDANNQLSYNKNDLPKFEKTILDPLDMLFRNGFAAYLGAFEKTPDSKVLCAVNFSIQNVLVNNLKTIDKNGLSGTEFLKHLGFEVKQDSDTLTFMTSDSVKYPDKNAKEKKFGVNTVTIDGNNNVTEGITTFTYTDANGKVLDTMNCSSKGMVQFMTDFSKVKGYDWQNTTYSRTGTVNA